MTTKELREIAAAGYGDLGGDIIRNGEHGNGDVLALFIHHELYHLDGDYDDRGILELVIDRMEVAQHDLQHVIDALQQKLNTLQ